MMNIDFRIMRFRYFVNRKSLFEIHKKVSFLASTNYPERSKSYRSIGEPELIRLRSERTLPVKPGGSFRDYVSFYLGPRPVMY
jgi:hypothetical protein